MGPTKIMIVRHAEKPGAYGGEPYQGIDAQGKPDPESLVTLGWARAGGIANLFAPTNGCFQNAALAAPAMIFASDPAKGAKEASQRPYQTILPLAQKLNIKPDDCVGKKDFADMVTDVLSRGAIGTVLISWQHQDILPKASGDDSIVGQLIRQTGSDGGALGIPSGPWPGGRYDMVFVFDRPSGIGAFTRFTQVPQMLLAGDVDTPFQ